MTPEEIPQLESGLQSTESMLTKFYWELADEIRRHGNRNDGLVEIGVVWRFIKNHLLDLHITQSISEQATIGDAMDYKRYEEDRAATELGLSCLRHNAISVDEHSSRMYHGGTDRDYTLLVWVSRPRQPLESPNE